MEPTHGGAEQPSSRLAGKTILVTGAAQGIGAATARALSRRGASLALVDIRADELRRLVGELGERSAAYPADTTDHPALQNAVESAVERFGGIDAVIANAGVETLGALGEIDPDDFQRVVDVNLVGTWKTVRATLPAVSARRGYYLVVTSLAAVTHAPFNGAYNAAKSGVVALAKTLRMELRPSGVAVGIAYVTYADTETARRSVEDPRLQALLRGVPGGAPRPMPTTRVADAFVLAVERRQRRLLFDRPSLVAVNLPELAQRIGERMFAPAMRRLDAGARRSSNDH
ncbi:MAG: short-chain dehydrogenase/reductase [Chloroflexota bacterium]|nr:short-chain dehydrogenase/reductase [Chloroflexota bacterium]